MSFSYRRRALPIVRGLNVEFGIGRTALLGPNGAGKSTLMGLAVGRFRPSSGSIDRIDCSVGWMPQELRPLSGSTAHEQVAYAGWLSGMASSMAWEAAGDALSSVGLDKEMARSSNQLSGGQLRRVGLAQAIVGAPQLLVLDEPFAGLDPRERLRLSEALLALPDRVGVVVSTHLIDDLDSLYDRVVVLDGGTVAFDGSISTFLNHGSGASTALSQSAYLGLTTER